MKKSILTTVIAVVAILFGAAEANARKTINAKGAVTVRTETVANFESLINKSVGKVIYEEGDKPSVKISGPNNVVPYIEVRCNGGKLEIRHKDNTQIRLNGKRLEIVVVGKKVQNFGTEGPGDIDIIADVKTVSAGVTGAGSVTLKGKADVAKFGVSGAGDIEAEKMKVGDVEAGVSGSGDIYCHAIRRLAATSTSSGKVVYSGNPTEVAAGRNVKHRVVKK